MTVGDSIYYVYILINRNNKVLYAGFTNNLPRRLHEHKNKLIEGFTIKYNVDKLVYFDCATDVKSAIAKEKQIEGWTRQKKNELIESVNPEWKDLSGGWGREDSSLRSEWQAGCELRLFERINN